MAATKKDKLVDASPTSTVDSDKTSLTGDSSLDQQKTADGDENPRAGDGDKSDDVSQTSSVDQDKTLPEEGLAPKAEAGDENPPAGDVDLVNGTVIKLIAVRSIAMRRDEPVHENGPVTADVHPDEVKNWLAHGWSIIPPDELTLVEQIHDPND